MYIFYSDLDNTLIYSCRRQIGNEKKCVETYEGREVSYMTNTSYRLLKAVCKIVRVIPTTTRTVEQYERIRLGLGTLPYALVCNGGVLLVDGKEDEQWYQKSLEMVEESREELEKAMGFLKEDVHRSFEIRNIRELFLFTKSSMPEKTVTILREVLNTDKVQVFNNGAKIYVLPQNLTKGLAVKRLTERLQGDRILAAGDSEFDISMLQVADMAFAPKALYEKCHQTAHWMMGNGEQVLSDYMLQSILDLVK